MSNFSNALPEIASKLIAARQTISVAESSTGGLLAASLLSVPGASGYFAGGSVIYTLASRRIFLDLDKERMKAVSPMTQAMVLEFAKAARDKLDATWGLAELGAAGPAGTPYGHAAGTSVIGLWGPLQCAITITTGSDNRQQNMWHFCNGALDMLNRTL